MKYLILTFFIMLSFSCTKEDVCQECTVLVETNFEEAQRKCDGGNNNYPALSFFATGTAVRCGDEIAESKAAAGTEQTTLCEGVTVTIRTKVTCKDL